MQLSTKLMSRVKSIGDRIEVLTNRIESISDPQKSAERIEKKNQAKIQAMEANLDIFLEEEKSEQTNAKISESSNQDAYQIQSLEELQEKITMNRN